ncbi:MAG TPA: STAS domain-containing protein [Terriglobia bacterium]|nr:STAS domain-containing protein [Terriglobia bacterium]
MELKLSRRESDGVSIIDLSGKITAGDSITAFRDAVRDEVAKGNARILINLKDVTYVDSSGLGELVLALGTVTQTVCSSCGASLFKDDDGQWEACGQCSSVERRPWGQLKLSNPGRQITDLLHFTKLNSVFDVRDTESDAISSFVD